MSGSIVGKSYEESKAIQKTNVREHPACGKTQVKYFKLKKLAETLCNGEKARTERKVMRGWICRVASNLKPR